MKARANDKLLKSVRDSSKSVWNDQGSSGMVSAWSCSEQLRKGRFFIFLVSGVGTRLAVHRPLDLLKLLGHLMGGLGNVDRDSGPSESEIEEKSD